MLRRIFADYVCCSEKAFWLPHVKTVSVSLLRIHTGQEAIRLHLRQDCQDEKQSPHALRLLRHQCKEGGLRQQTVSVREDDDGWENSATTNDQGLSVFPCSPSLSLSNFILRSFITEPWWRDRNKTYFFFRPWEILLMTKSEMTERLFISVRHHQTRFPSTDWPNIYEEKFWQATARQRTDGSWHSFTPPNCTHASTQRKCD